jgi:hypothetical protein
VRAIFIAIVLTSLAFDARATLPVVDYSHIAQDATNEVVNLAKWTKTELDAAQTELNTLRSYENSIISLTRLGDPGALRNLPVIGTIAQLAGEGQQALREYQQLQQLATNVKQMPSNLSAVTSAYGLQQWNPLAPGAYQFPAASYAVANSVQQQMIALEQQRQMLEQKRDATLQSLQSATDQSSVQKYSAILTGVNGALATVAARANELAQRSQLQQMQLNAGAAVQRQQTTETGATSFSNGVINDMNSLGTLAPDFTQPVPRWPGGMP